MKNELKQLREAVDTLSDKTDQLTTAMLSELSTNTKPSNSSYASVTSAPPAQSATTAQMTGEKHIRYDNSSRPAHEQDPVTAMYMDLNLKKQRANNFMITGMPATQSSDEIKAVVVLLVFEFNWDKELWPGVSVARC